MKQISFADAEFAAKKRVTRRERFFGEMEQVVPWAALLAVLAPHDFPGAEGRRGRAPIGLERMRRMYFLQQWFGLSDEGLEDAIYDSQALRGFLGLDLGREAVPDATTLLGFRHLLEAQGLTEVIFQTVNAGLRARGLMLAKGTVTDATIIAAPLATSALPGSCTRSIGERRSSSSASTGASPPSPWGRCGGWAPRAPALLSGS